MPSIMLIAMLMMTFMTSTPPAYAANGDRNNETIIITSNQVYAEVERIEADVLSIMKYRNHISTSTLHQLPVHFKSQHVWQKTYEILVKINILRRTENYPTIAVNTLEPTKRLHPKMVYDQTQRILTELALIKVRFNLTQSAPTPAAKTYTNKTPSNVYALLDKVSQDLDTLIGFGFTPSDVFSQVIRLNSDIDLILHAFDITDNSFPPIKHPSSQPRDAFRAGMALLKTVNKIQQSLAIDTTDFSALKHATVTPSNVFELVGLISAELQPIKFSLLLRYDRTPTNKHYEGKTPADVEQLIGWCNNRLKQIRSSRL